MSKHHAKAIWTGPVLAGTGSMQLGKSGPSVPYNLKARVEEEAGTNPEQMIGAALAGCFSMSVANLIEETGLSMDGVEIKTSAIVTLTQTDQGFRINQVDLSVIGAVEGMANETFLQLAQKAKDTCPVSLLYASANITLEAKLAS
jgi:osmotically inducible protein OsmC